MRLWEWVAMGIDEIKERRNRAQRRLTISEILDQMQAVADRSFNGDLQSNALAIFNKLPQGSKRTFLRQSLMTIWGTQIDLARSGFQEVVIEDDMKIIFSEIAKERKELEVASASDDSKMVSKIYMIIFWVALVVVLIVGGLLFFSSPAASAASPEELSMYQRLTRVLDYFLKLKG